MNHHQIKQTKQTLNKIIKLIAKPKTQHPLNKTKRKTRVNQIKQASKHKY